LSAPLTAGRHKTAVRPSVFLRRSAAGSRTHRQRDHLAREDVESDALDPWSHEDRKSVADASVARARGARPSRLEGYRMGPLGVGRPPVATDALVPIAKVSRGVRIRPGCCAPTYALPDCPVRTRAIPPEARRPAIFWSLGRHARPEYAHPVLQAGLGTPPVIVIGRATRPKSQVGPVRSVDEDNEFRSVVCPTASQGSAMGGRDLLGVPGMGDVVVDKRGSAVASRSRMAVQRSGGCPPSWATSHSASSRLRWVSEARLGRDRRRRLTKLIQAT